MKTSIIVAVAQNWAIGKDNNLLWNLPADMKFFKETTSGHPVITGRKNYESIPEKFRPLPGRKNIVVTRKNDYSAPGAVVVNSLQSAIAEAKLETENEVFIIGGGEIYKQALQQNLVDKMYVTHVHESFDADTFFPEISPSKWREVSRKDFPIDEKNKYIFHISVYEKIR